MKLQLQEIVKKENIYMHIYIAIDIYPDLYYD